MICLLFASPTRKTQPNSLLSVECWQLVVQ